MSAAAPQNSPETFYLDQCNYAPVGIILPPAPFRHPFRSYSSSCLMSQLSLETCTECLGSETGSDGFSSSSSYSIGDGLKYCHSTFEEGVNDACTVESGELLVAREKDVMASVKYHCSVRRQSPALRSTFPPPLTSISRRDAPCVQLRSHRDDGRLVVEAIAAPCRKYLHARRVDGRLVICLVDPAAGVVIQEPPKQGSQSELEEEEILEVKVDRGSVVEVKAMSEKPKKQRGGVKAHRYPLIIHKFVGGTNHHQYCDEEEQMNNKGGGIADSDKILLMLTAKRRKRKEVLKRMRRCSELRRPPLFVWDSSNISTTAS